MNFYFAPLEGITGYVYRRVHHEIFGQDIARYFTPFVVANYTKKLKTRERMDILPQNNAGIPLVPQILANDPDAFLATARAMAELGYPEVNINLGCPVSTVVSKHKGAGMLQYPDELDRFLHGVFEGARKIQTPDGHPLRISIKTRLGFASVEEAPAIFAVYRQYPIAELIIHARTRQEQYAGMPELDAFLSILSTATLPVCYNGNIATVQDYQYLQELLSSAECPVSVNCMIGRGLTDDPGLVRRIRTGQETTKAELLCFHNRLLEGYEEQYASFHGQTSGQMVIVNRMKEVWTHLGHSFQDNGRYLKNIHKAKNYTEYTAAVRMLFSNCAVTTPAPGLVPPT